ncbi:hypothetical protein L2Y96_02115 [Luteibacter aegosomaticola]|uniref:hypothetical protein n=1 Tax=Luteibacter aegosomaticola TaxID=2911538 RepID=UPI001FF986EA|nr:hypothetical protein [Luteibacter aegosomaticola]UPG90589.1 hypothetical protein L2Y96_02115 [Luteibacter aegosomaticola]
MTITISLRLKSTHLTVDDFELALGRRASFCWGPGDHRFSPDGEHMAGFRENSFAIFDLFQGGGVSLADALEKALRELSDHRNLFRQLEELGDNAEVSIDFGRVLDAGGTLSPQLIGELNRLGLGLRFASHAQDLSNASGSDDRSVNTDATRSFLRAIVNAEHASDGVLDVCVKYRGDRSVYDERSWLREERVGMDGVADPGFGSGPVSYSDVDWLCVPAVSRWSADSSGYASRFQALVTACADIPGAIISGNEVMFFPAFVKESCE